MPSFILDRKEWMSLKDFLDINSEKILYQYENQNPDHYMNNWTHTETLHYRDWECEYAMDKMMEQARRELNDRDFEKYKQQILKEKEFLYSNYPKQW